MTFEASSINFTGEAWPVPASVRLDGPFLSWQLGRNPAMREITDSLLTDFAQLVTAEPEAIATFARDHGVLFVEECSRAPAAHEHRPETEPACRSRPFDPGFMKSGRERIETWLDYAGRVRAMLRLIEAIRAGEAGSVEAWSTVRPPFARDEEVPAPKTVQEANRELATHVRWWLRIGDVRPGFDVQHENENEPDFRLWLAGDGLFGGLAYALMLRLGHASELVMCSNAADPMCERLYEPKTRSGRPRRPRAGERNYCETCRRRGIPWRDAKRDQRAGEVRRPRRQKGTDR